MDVTFNILTGSGMNEYYVGDHFWYNITITNRGISDIDATFTVNIYNTTGGVIQAIRNFEVILQPNNTEILYPNCTRNGKEEVNIYFFETPGTYSIEVLCDIYLIYYRYYDYKGYTLEYNECKHTFDVMPSYQKVQNERWNEFLFKNEEYMDNIDEYIKQSRIESIRTKNISYLSIFISVSSMMVGWMGLPKETRKQYRSFYFIIAIFLLAFLILITL